MLSYWERESFTYYHHIVAGGGLVGISTAIELKEKFPSEQVLVLERALLPTGATTRNAGFACMGSVTELLNDLQTMSEKEVMRLFEARRNGLLRLRRRLGDAAIRYCEEGSYELLDEAALPSLERIGYLNDLLRPVLGGDAFSVASEKINAFRFSNLHVKAMARNNGEGSLHSGALMKALLALALSKGVGIITGAEITGFEEGTEAVSVQVQSPFRKDSWPLRCETFTICTNAFARQLLPDEDVKPGRGQVLITKPVAGLPFKGIFHFDAGYFYFRELDGRVLLGGGRNLDFAGEATTDILLNAKIQQQLETELRERILPGRDVEIDQRWAGIMAFGQSKQPVVKAFSNRIFGAFRMGGMGVALGSEAAAEAAGMVALNR